MMTPLEAAREVLGLHQDTVIREDDVTHFFTPDKVDRLANMGPEYYITCKYIHIAPMITGYDTVYIGATADVRPEIMWYTRPACEMRFRMRQTVRVFERGIPEWIREIQFVDPVLGETAWHGGPVAWWWNPDEGLTINFRYHGEDPYPHRLEQHFSSERVTAAHGRCLRQRTSSFWWGQKMERGSMHHIALSDATYKRKEGSSTAGTILVGLAGQHSAVTQRPGWAPDTDPRSAGGEVDPNVRMQFEELTGRCERAIARRNAGESTHRHPGEADARMGDSSDDEYLDPNVVSL